jgi:type IV/VI secretion system ImpK/VasF family protein
MWSRVRDRIAGLFTRRHDDSEELIATDSHETAVADLPIAPSAEMVEHEIEDSVESSSAPSEEAPRDYPGADDSGQSLVWLNTSESVEAPPSESTEEPPAVAPPEDFKFPWTRLEIDVSTENVPRVEPEPELVDTGSTDAVAETAPVAKPRGFFSRLFGRKPKHEHVELRDAEPAFVVEDQAIVDATSVDATSVDATSVDDAPADAAPFAETPSDAAEAPSDEAESDDVRVEQSRVEDALIWQPPVDEPAPVVAHDDNMDVIEPPPEEPVAALDATFTSVDDALPVSEDSALDEEAVVDFEEAAAEVRDDEPPAPKRGLFARLFRRGSKEEEPKRLSVEVYQDRIEAAANALDTAGEAVFTPGEDTLPAAENTFDSVEEALPSGVDAFADTLEPIDVPLPPPTFKAASETLPSIDDFAPPAVAPSETEPETSSRSTLELETKTDEFELLPPESVEPPPEAPGDETISLEKKSIWTGSFLDRIFSREATKVEKVGAEAEEAAKANAIFLLAKFRAFYNEIIRFKHQKSEFAAGFATAIVSDYAADSSPDASAEGLSKRLTELLELQAAEAKWMGGEAGDRYPDAQYAMAALADETFANMEWDGQAAWPKYSIERKLYQSNAADVDVFKRIDKLLKDSPDSVVARDLARVYLLVIAAGFRGKYRPFGLTRALAEYRHRLYEYIHNDDALMLYAPERKIFPEAESQTLAGHAVRRFTAAQRWAAILILLIVSYTVIAHVAWNRASADLKDVTARIKSGGATAGVR